MTAEVVAGIHLVVESTSLDNFLASLCRTRVLESEHMFESRGT